MSGIAQLIYSMIPGDYRIGTLDLYREHELEQIYRLGNAQRHLGYRLA